MKLSSGIFVLLENAHAAVTIGPRTNDDTAYGDMVFSDCQYERMLKDPRLPSGLHFNHDGSTCSSPLERTFPPWRGYQDDADGKFIVPYFFDFGYNNTEYDGFLGEQSASAIRWKLGEMNKKLNVKFVEIYPDEVDLYPDHIEIVSEENDDFLSACASYIGKIGGKQKWYMRPDCAFHDYSQVNHFAMYILGFGPAFTRNYNDFHGAGYHESLLGNANYHYLVEEFQSIWHGDERSVSNLLPYKLEDGSTSMFDDYIYGDITKKIIRDFPVSNSDINRINAYYPLDIDNLCLNGWNKCPAEASCRPIPHNDKYICDCPDGTITSKTDSMWEDQKCVVPGEMTLFEWTNTTHFIGYELRVAPYLELFNNNGSRIWHYDRKQEIYGRATLTDFGPPGAPVDPEFWPEIQNNAQKFEFGAAGLYDLVVPEAGYYQFSYEIIDGQGNKLFPEFDIEGGTHDVNELAPVSVTMENIPEILPSNITHEVTMQMINELGEPVSLGPQAFDWLDFEWDLIVEYQNPNANWTYRSYISRKSCNENGRINFKMNLVDAADSPWLMENEDLTPPVDLEEMRKLSPAERQQIFEKSREKATEDYHDRIWPVYVTTGLVRLIFANWGFNEMIKDLPIEETNFHYSEWFILASANCTDCHEFAQCNVEGMCECNEGFSGDGYSYCIPESNECEIYPDICGKNSYCLDKLIDYECECFNGFKPIPDEDVGCQDINECMDDHACADGTVCKNTVGSFTCEVQPPCDPKCEKGYICDDGECVDFNECDAGKHDCRDFESCRNTQGSFVCDFKKELCDDLDLPKPEWKGRKGMRYIYKSEAGSLMAMKLRNNGKLDIRQNLYSGLFVWTKDVCGMDFMRAMEDGRIRITLIDSTDIYDLEHVHYKSFAKYSSIGISFDLTEVVTKDTPWKFVKGIPTKNLASDDVQIMLTGLDKVSFLTTEENCLLTGGAAYLESREYTDLERSCLIEGKTFWSKPVLPAA